MISIDIGSKKVGVAEGSFRGDTVTVTAFGEIEYESEVVVNGAITDRPALSFLINEIIKTKRMKSKAAVVTVSSSDTIIREFKFPNVKLPQLKLLVSNEMYRVVRDESGFVVDFVVTGMTEDKMLTVMACAVPKQLVESYSALLKELKLTPYALTIPEDSVAKLLSKTSLNGNVHDSCNIIVVDIGYSRLAFYGFSKGISRFNRSDVSPVQEFVREVGSLNRIDVTMDYMQSLDLSPNYEYENTAMTDTCRYFIYRLSEEIQKYTQYLIMNSELKEVEKIYICGGISNVNGLDIALTESLRIPVETIRSVGRLKVASGLPVTKLCVAAGALMRK